MSSGLQSILTEIVKWSGLVIMFALVIFNFETLKTELAGITGLEPPHGQAEDQSKRNIQRTSVSAGPTVVLKARRNGHFFAPVRMNGHQVDTMVDTGASSVALTYEDARAAGIFVGPGDFTGRARTANGVARVAPVMIDQIEIDGITVRNVRGSVIEQGQLHITLLGMSFLSKLERFEMSDGKLILKN